MNESIDENAVHACQRGDKEAYATLVERHYRHVFALCLGILGNVHDAEDAAQEALLKGLAKIGRLGRARRFEPWILKIARNQCLDLLRKRKHLKTLTTPQITEPARKVNNNHDLERAIRQLPLELRLPLTMYYFEQKNAGIVARKLNISHSLACQRLRAARNELHTLLTKGGSHER